MSLTIGQTIKKLRKERNLTQEELAEQLNVTFQAVSKWENETGLPDISQIVPLASVFGVSTDVLFGTIGTNDDEEVKKIIQKAYDLKGDNTTESLKCVYDALQEGLCRYPNNDHLLENSLEMGISLAYPENDCYDKIHGEEIYRECIRQANVLISYSKNATNILRAHMIMVMLHSAYGNSEKAWEHAIKFPGRADMTIHVMSAYIAHFENNYDEEVRSCQGAIMLHSVALCDDLVLLGETHLKAKNYDAALRMFKRIFEIRDIIYSHRPIPPFPLHRKDGRDVHALIARTYLEMDEIENALDWIEKMVDYDIISSPQINVGSGDENLSVKAEKKRLLKKLNATEFECLKNNEKFLELLNRANAMNE